jgi:hypothetical protein
MTNRTRLMSFFVLLFLVVAPTILLAKSGQSDRVQFFQNIEVGPNESVGDLVCLFCSIHNSGTSGDNVAILGSIVVDGTVNGDCVAVGGAIRLGEDASVAGDTVGLGGGVSRHPNSSVKGQMVSEVGPFIFLGMILGPLIPVVLVVWLIVWLVRRDRRVVVAPVAYRR